ncbi:unnamed protein product [Porites evermanni]|uniref:Uncharacterized protein n=1 Tax=Porites evermanni TaxID=104178 RepID=A0ABN8MLB8_9CNID|nr:unnamed protein product [Porites evermanni]
MEKMRKAEELEFLHGISEKVVDSFIFHHSNCFLFFNFLNAIKEGGGAWIMRQYKYIMLYCKADGSHSTKYALECLYQVS